MEELLEMVFGTTRPLSAGIDSRTLEHHFIFSKSKHCVAPVV